MYNCEEMNGEALLLFLHVVIVFVVDEEKIYTTTTIYA